MNQARRAIDVHDESGMIALGRQLGSAAVGRRGFIVYLEGDLGAGKTTLTRGWLAGMGYSGRVKSPTYTLLEPYSLPGDEQLTHMDLYRVGDPEELEFLGLREIVGSGQWLLVEWPEKGAGHLPRPDLEVHIRFQGQGRSIELLAGNTAAALWLEGISLSDTVSR